MTKNSTRRDKIFKYVFVYSSYYDINIWRKFQLSTGKK